MLGVTLILVDLD